MASAAGGECKRRAEQPLPQPPPQHRLRHRHQRQQTPQTPQQQQQEAAAAPEEGGGGEERRQQEKQKTADAFRVRLRRSEHALSLSLSPDPDAAAASSKRFTAVPRASGASGARNKMLKQSASPAEADSDEPSPRSGVALLTVVAGLEDKKPPEDQDPVQDHDNKDDPTELPSQTTPTTMTTATSPPPPPPDTEQPAQQLQQQPHAGSEADADERPESTSTRTSVEEDLGALKNRLVCSVCDGVLPSDVALSSHITELGLNHTGSEAGSDLQGFACRVCRRVFDNAEVLDRHVLSHPGEQVFKCPLCEVTLRTNGGLARHTRRHMDGHVDLLRQSKSVKRSLSSHPDDADFEVEVKRRSPSNVGSDEDTVVAPPRPTLRPALSVPQFTCPVCPPSQPFRAQYLPDLEAHLEHSHRDYSVPCDLCGGSFRNVRDLNLHVHTAHRSSKASRGRDVKGFSDLTFVDFSSQKFAQIARVECEKSLHRAASRLHPFLCECGLAFPCDSALAIHRQACPNTVYVDSPADLSRGGSAHPVHADQMALRPASPKGDFLAKLELSPQGALHLPRCTDRDVPYDRDLAPVADIQSILSASAVSCMGVGQADQGEEHEEQQDAFAVEFRKMKQKGEFPCRLCPEVFPNLRALKGHNRTHMAAPGSDGYRCNMCPHAALDKVALQRHMRTHNGARPYECALCRFAFTTKANCERHLRNRHAKCSRDEVKSSIIYHPSEDPGNDPEQQRELQQQLQQQLQSHIKLDVKRSLFPDPMLFDPEAPEDIHRRRSLDVGTMTSASEDDLDDRVEEPADEVMDDQDDPGRQSPLDLSMVLDLSKKRPPSPSPEEDVPEDDEVLEEEEDDDQPQDLSRKPTSDSSAAAAPTSLHESLHHNNLSTPLQSPEPAATAATLPFPLYPLNPLNPYQLGQMGQMGQMGQPGPGLAPTLPFPAAYYPGLLRSLQLSQGLGQGLGQDLVFEPIRLLQRPAMPFLPSVPVTTPGHGVDRADAASIADSQDDVVICPAASPKSECSESHPQQSISGGSSSGSSSKMVMKNGVLMPKQKQRRYRTERPFMCEYCSAKFTLSSNRERHVKHQHPQFWRRPRCSSTGNGGNPSTPPHPPAPAPVDASTPLRAPSVDLVVSSKHEEDDEDEGLVIDEERPSSEDHHDDEGAEGDAEDEGHVKMSSTPVPTSAGEDLASVSRLLNNASMQTFRHFLRDGDDHQSAPVPISLPHPAMPSGPEEALGSEEDVDEEGLVAGSPSDGNNSGSEQDKSESEAAAVPPKKKSAYSLAPNRVCCPYCSRKFPWTSSLRRHVLTHTGQKPYKCTYCPLLFTTKSNCDRHLARKHSNKKDAANSSSSSGVSSTPNSSTTSVSPGSSASSGSPPEALSVRDAALSPHSYGGHGLGPLRNVPERPHRCKHCPSSTFATFSNLRKHVASKHAGATLESCILAGDVSGYESHGSISDAEHADDREDDKKMVMKIPVLDQPLSLCKVEKSEDVKLERKDIKEEPALNLRRSSDSDIMREAHNSLMSSATPISAPVVSIPEGSTRSSESSITLPSSELPFKCHLCEGSFTERQECLDHIRLGHAPEYDILLKKGALDPNITHSPEDNGNAMDDNHHGDGDNNEHVRGKFPDYANRKVMCAFCMRRFWSAEDLRRHMRTHTGERPFSCDVCRRRFTLKHSMLRHRKKHSEISNNNNSLTAPLVNSTGPEDLSPSATSGEEESFRNTSGSGAADLLMYHQMTNHNNNNISYKMAGVNNMLMAAMCDNQVNLKRNFRRKDDEGSGLISNLLGIGDPSIIDKVLLSKSADDAEKLLGFKQPKSADEAEKFLKQTKLADDTEKVIGVKKPDRTS